VQGDSRNYSITESISNLGYKQTSYVIKSSARRISEVTQTECIYVSSSIEHSHLLFNDN